MAQEITLDEMLAEYTRLGMTTESRGLTAQEMADETGRRVSSIREMLRQAQRAGILRRGTKPGERTDGRAFTQTTYWFERPSGATPGKGKRGSRGTDH